MPAGAQGRCGGGDAIDTEAAGRLDAVFVRNDLERRMPYIEPFDGARTLPEGERLKLICKASGNPRPVLYWYRNGRILKGDDSGSELSLHSRYLPRLRAARVRRHLFI